MSNLFYVIANYIIISFSIKTIAAFVIPFKKGRKVLGIALLILLELIVPIPVAVSGHFATGYESLPFIHFPLQLFGIVIMYFYAKGNPFKNFSLLWVYSSLWFFIWSIFIPSLVDNLNPISKPLKTCSGIGDLHLFFIFAAESIFAVIISIYSHKIIYSYYRSTLKIHIVSIIIFGVLMIALVISSTENNGIYHASNYISVILYSIFFVVVISYLLFIYVLTFSRDTKVIQKIYEETTSDYIEIFSSLNGYRNSIREWRHDIRNHISTLKQMGYSQTDNYLQEATTILDASTTSSSPAYICSNPILNSLFVCKKITADEHNIQTNFEIYMSNAVIDDVDLIGLFSNLIDNAIEACEGVPNDKSISVITSPHYNYLHIKVTNTKDPSRIILKDGLKTTKPDKDNHGYGTHIIRKIVEKYNGELSYEETNDTFTVSIILQV